MRNSSEIRAKIHGKTKLIRRQTRHAVAFSLVHCGQLTFWLSFVFLSLSLVVSLVSVVLDCTDSWSLPPFLICNHLAKEERVTIVPTKNDSDAILCLPLLNKTLTCTPHLSKRESIDHLCIKPILRIGLIHKWSIDSKSLITLLTKHDVTVTLGWQDSSCFSLSSWCHVIVSVLCLGLAQYVIVAFSGFTYLLFVQCDSTTYQLPHNTINFVRRLSLCILGNFSRCFCRRQIYFSSFFKNHLGTLSECQMVWIQIRPMFCRAWFWLQTICKDVKLRSISCILGQRQWLYYS